ncbi:MAG: circularly permuted type 2 ATP-grasp protein, partial [Gammaproteobacteria bacterium]|nr:circularly permuted type 2 ATP-grasp protein [Gammaproteobacteria bacterium]
MGLGRATDAIAELEAAVRAQADTDIARFELGFSAALLGRLYVQSGQGDKALPALRRALELLPAGVKELEMLRNPAEDDLGYAFLQLDRLDAAEYLLECALTRTQGQHGAVSIEYADRLWQAAQLYGRQHRFAYAGECARRCVSIRSKLLQADDPKRAQAHLILAGILETRAMLAFLPRICQAVMQEPLKMPNIATWWCGQESERAHVRANAHRMMIGSALSTRMPFDPESSTGQVAEFPWIEQQQLLLSLVQTLNSTLVLSQVLEQVLDAVMRITKAERGFLLLAPEDAAP